MKTVRQKYTYVLALLLVVVVGWAVARLPRGTGEAPGVSVAIAQPAPAPPAPGGQALPADEEALLVAWVQASEGVTVPRVAGERRSGAEAAVDPLPEPPENAPAYFDLGLYGGVSGSSIGIPTRLNDLDAYLTDAGIVAAHFDGVHGGRGALLSRAGDFERWLDPVADADLRRVPARLQPSGPANPPYKPPTNDWLPEERCRTWSGPLLVLDEAGGTSEVPLPDGVTVVHPMAEKVIYCMPRPAGWAATLQCLDSSREPSVAWLSLNEYQGQGLLLVTSDGAGESATQVLPARMAPELGLPAGQVASIGYSYPMVALDGQSVYALWAGEYGRQVDADYVPPTSQGRQRLALRLHALVRWTPPAAPAVIDAVAILAPAPATPEGEAQAKMAWLLDDEGRFSERSGAPFWVDYQKMEPLAYRTQTPGGVAWTRLGVDRRLVEVD